MYDEQGYLYFRKPRYVHHWNVPIDFQWIWNTLTTISSISVDGEPWLFLDFPHWYVHRFSHWFINMRWCTIHLWYTIHKYEIFPIEMAMVHPLPQRTWWRVWPGQRIPWLRLRSGGPWKNPRRFPSFVAVASQDFSWFCMINMVMIYDSWDWMCLSYCIFSLYIDFNQCHWM